MKFIQNTSEQEIAQNLKSNLLKFANREKSQRGDKYDRIIKNLDKAASLLNQIGLSKEANIISTLKTKVAMTDFATVNLSSERMIKNEIEKGRILNANNKVEVVEEPEEEDLLKYVRNM